MKKNDKLVVVLGVIVLILASIGVYYWDTTTEAEILSDFEDLYYSYGEFEKIPNAVTVSNSNPFYALIATPLCVHYDEEGMREVIPLYVKDIDDPSKAITRSEQMINIFSDVCISDVCAFGDTVDEISMKVAEEFWEYSPAAVILEHSQLGYNLGLAVIPLASYLSIPVIVTDTINAEITQALDGLGVEYSIICGNLTNYKKTMKVDNVDDVVNDTISFLEEKFGKIDYLTLTNPLDVTEAEVFDDRRYHFEGTVSSVSMTPTNLFNMAIGMLSGTPPLRSHEFEVPDDYKYARITVEIRSLIDEDVEETGSSLQPQLIDPDGNLLAFMFTTGGIPEMAPEGGIETDKIVFDTVLYDKPGMYTVTISGKFLTSKTGDYEVDVHVESIDRAINPQMPGLSSIAPYVNAYHKGIILAKPEFAFAADESILDNPPAGVYSPASNPELIDPSNEHVFDIHEDLNHLLARLQGMEYTIDNDHDDVKALKDYYEEFPMYIALVGDATMIPHYYYYDTDDAISLNYGWDVASDFIYGNIDAIPRDDHISIYQKDRFISANYDDQYPYQENIVGRITGWDIQDASALVARTFFYDHIINNVEFEDWKDRALVQTGSGTDFQRLPVFDTIRQVMGGLVGGLHDLPVKWPTGEAHFENLIIQDSLEDGGFEIKSTENTESMRRGLSDKTLKEVKRLGLLNMLLFPKQRAKKWAGEAGINPNGGEDQMNSNFIFTFGHGQPMGYSHGDVQTNSIGMGLGIIYNYVNRLAVLIPSLIPGGLSTGLGNVGGYSVRYVSNFEMGPSVMFVESCYIGRIDGFPAKAVTNQAYIHAGLNAFYASSRGTPGPGYLDVRKKPIGLGLAEYIKTKQNPDLQKPHFSALHAVNIFDDLIDNNADVGTAFRTARNKFWLDVESEFYWTPPLCIDVQTVQDLQMLSNSIKPLSDSSDARCMEKKYTCFMEYNLFADPAFNPYEPSNEGGM